MRRIHVPLIATLTCAGLFFVPQMHIAFAHGPERTTHQDFPPRPGATPIVIGLPNLNPPTATALPSGSHPRIPPKARAPQDVVRVALGNAYVKALLSGKPYRIQKVVVVELHQGQARRCRLLQCYHRVGNMAGFG